MLNLNTVKINALKKPYQLNDKAYCILKYVLFIFLIIINTAL